MTAITDHTRQIIARTGAALLGGYCFVWGFVTLGIALGLAAGMPYDEARTLCFLLAFLIFVVAFCWAFVTPSYRRAWLILAGGGATLSLAGWLLANALN